MSDQHEDDRTAITTAWWARAHRTSSRMFIPMKSVTQTKSGQIQARSNPPEARTWC